MQLLQRYCGCTVIKYPYLVSTHNKCTNAVSSSSLLSFPPQFFFSPPPPPLYTAISPFLFSQQLTGNIRYGYHTSVVSTLNKCRSLQHVSVKFGSYPPPIKLCLRINDNMADAHLNEPLYSIPLPILSVLSMSPWYHWQTLMVHHWHDKHYFSYCSIFRTVLGWNSILAKGKTLVCNFTIQASFLYFIFIMCGLIWKLTNYMNKLYNVTVNHRKKHKNSKRRKNKSSRKDRKVN